MSDRHSDLLEFGNCRLDCRRKLLWADDRPVQLPLKAIELLCVLVAGRGEVVTKGEIWREVWQDSFVEETNLTHNIYLLRQALKKVGQDKLIETVPRRGYRFCAEVREICGGDLVLERHSISKTLIQDISDTRPITQAVASSKRIFAAAALATIPILALVGLRNWPAPATNIRSMAVLPFRSVDSSNPHRGLGLADILITRLSVLKNVAVRPISSVAGYEEQTIDPVQVGQTLGVDAVLDGNIYQAGSDVRITMRLVSTKEGKTLWSGEFDKPAEDELKLQNDIALRVADTLALDLDPQERRALEKHYTDDREAYEAYLRGRFFFDKRDPEMYVKAIDEYQKAISVDPSYALAYSGLADVYSMQANEADDSRRDDLYGKARQALQKALSIDDELGEAHTSLAWIKRIHDWDWEGSEKEFARAIELDPNYDNARMWHSFLLLTLGKKDEALAEMEKARELAPLNVTVLNNYATVRYFRQDNEDLLPIAELTKSLGARDHTVLLLYSSAYLRQGKYQQAIDLINDFNTRNNNESYATLQANLATAYGLSGQSAKADAIIRSLAAEAKTSGQTAYRLSIVYAALGRKDEAIACLQKALSVHDDRLMWIKVEPRFDDLRPDPRFQEILRAMRLA